MLQRISPINIIKDHLGTLTNINSNSNRVSVGDLLLFFIIPLALSVLLVSQGLLINNQLSNILTAVAILCGFLFNLLAIIYGLMDNLKKDSEHSDLKKIFVNQVHVNISFNILVAIFLIVLLISNSFILNCQGLVTSILSVVIYFLLMLFLLTLIMILNRIYILLKKD